MNLNLNLEHTIVSVINKPPILALRQNQATLFIELPVSNTKYSNRQKTSNWMLLYRTHSLYKIETTSVTFHFQMTAFMVHFQRVQSVEN